MDWNEISQDPRHLGVPPGVSKMIYKLMVCLAQIMHLSCTDTNTVSKRTENEIPLEPRHLGVQLGGAKTISEPIVHSGQTVHPSCTDTNTVSKSTKMGFHKSHVT
jgi:hypothetical protein